MKSIWKFSCNHEIVWSLTFPFTCFFIFILAEAPKIELVEGEDGELMISIPISSAPKKLPQYYGFTTGRHSGSMFLKIGAAVFCVLHIIHLFLIIVKEVTFATLNWLWYS